MNGAPNITPPLPGTRPVGGLLDPRFRYTPAAATDIRKTFKRLQAAQRRTDAAQAGNRQGALL